MPKPTPKNPVILPTQQRSRITFENILEATTYLIEEIGIRQITTNKIAERSGVNINSIYQYFLDKHTIIKTVTERSLDQYQETFLTSLKNIENLPYKERALKIVGDLIQNISTRPKLNREILQNLPHIIGETQEEKFKTYLSEKLMAVIPEDLHPSPKSRKIAAEMLVHLFLNGIIFTLSPNISNKDKKLKTDELRHVILRYIGVNELSPRAYKDYFFYIPSQPS